MKPFFCSLICSLAPKPHTPANCILCGQPVTAAPLPGPLIPPAFSSEATPALHRIYSISQLMARHVNTEESAAHTKHIITITLLQPQLPGLLLSSPLSTYYIFIAGAPRTRFKLYFSGWIFIPSVLLKLKKKRQFAHPRRASVFLYLLNKMRCLLTS